jgi:hypothetical protein
MTNDEQKMKNEKKKLLIASITDLSKSFVDENGSFYCGSTKEHKENAKKIVEAVLNAGGIVVYNTDVHPYSSKEFSRNGGLYPIHNMPKKFWKEAYEENPELNGKLLSPELTDVVNDALKGVKTGIYAPRHVYFQDKGPTDLSYEPEDIEKTFGERILFKDEFLNEDYRYIIAPKKFFDATRLSTDIHLGRGVNRTKMPKIEENIWSLIHEKYPETEYNITIINPSVVEGICSLYTASGQKQVFPDAKIITPSDGITPLVGFAFETGQQSRDATKRIAADIGIEYQTTDQILKMIESYK